MPERKQRTDHKWVLVAGGSGGIGAAIGRELADDGWNLALTYRNSESAALAVAGSVRALGREAQVAQVDLTDAAATAELVRTLTPEPLSGVVYAAGPLVKMRYISELEPAEFRDFMLADSTAAFNVLHATLPALRETAGVCLAVVTTAIDRYAKKDLLSAAPKAAVQAAVRGIAAEEGRHGVRANCVAVGVLEGAGVWDTLIANGDFSADLITAARQSTALRRFGTVEDVAEATRFLMSDRANWITGQTLHVDGGYSV